MDGDSQNMSHVLVVDDDPGDVLLIQESLGQHAGLSSHVAGEGSQALRFVRRLGEFTKAPRPRLVLLDLNLSGVNGLEFLAEVKADTDLLTIPVVVLSSSRHPDDIARSYALHANAYMVKPVDIDHFNYLIGMIAEIFIQLAEPPLERCQHHPLDHPSPRLD